MIEIGLVIAVVMASGAWLKTRSWFPNDYIPLVIVVMAVTYNAINALLFGSDLLEAGKMAFIEATAAIGIHSGTKNSFQKGDVE
ncbi:hypothetical protein O0555_24490 [Brevibacillus laterosporus]|uniref:hypothetical protein n=1 Tax=Brevibacillus laterosporus TaxID=1465 RepID=UPI0018CFEBD5|nr:hypothetical protein [Brevibacillus laterosporus]MBG9798463.1 hypothetical protein [Brevibacillus laterosporus]MCR8940430.1 hypothetical protein [Brevibacillus laterosporus]MCZ0843069.1 hypothetical protein [Brevibacillus laterosporus]MCZ0847653.1 hypothetical protein [Brevibacillus laterosporus]MED1913332.1 hypothetical protein [Brevibacillus laterosporus]